MTIGLPEGGCVVSICYIVDDRCMVINNITNRNNTITLWQTNGHQQYNK
jgi:hypothetical protein